MKKMKSLFLLLTKISFIYLFNIFFAKKKLSTQNINESDNFAVVISNQRHTMLTMIILFWIDLRLWQHCLWVNDFTDNFENVDTSNSLDRFGWIN